MSERAERRAGREDPLVGQLLDAVDDPALVCGRDGGVRAWNRALAAHAPLPETDLAGAAVERLLDCDTDPVGRAVETGERTIDSGSVVGGSDCTVACRPVERDGTVTRVVVTVTVDGDAFAGDGAIYRAAVDAAPDSVYVVDREFTIRMVGEGFARYTGLPTDAIEGRDVACLYEEGLADDETFQEGMRALRALFEGRAERRQVTSTVQVGDRQRVVENRLAPIERNGVVVAVVHVVRDVTEREGRKDELEAVTRRLRTALSGTDAGVYECILDGDDRVYWHESTSRLFGLDPDTTERPTEAFYDRIHPDDRERVREAVDAAIESSGDLRVEYRVRRADGEQRRFVSEGEVVCEDGEPVRLVGMVRDVTERAEREQELAAREQELRAVIESSPDPLVMQDVDGRCRVVNQALVDTVGRSRSAILGATPEEVFENEPAVRLESHRRDVIDSERARVVEEQFTGADGDPRTVQLTLAPYYGPGDEVQGTVSIARDVTALQRQRDELETLTEIQELVQENVRALTAATTRAEIKETVCERLADSPFYEAAWIGERALSEPEIEPEFTAGLPDGYFESATITADTGDHGSGPAGEAYRTGEVQVVHDIDADPVFEPWREEAAAAGFESVVAVPLTQGSTTHGLLGVYADRANAFSRRELAGFETLGEVVGFALSATQYRRLLEADSALELVFEGRDDSPFAAVTRDRDCRFVFEGAVQTGDQRVVTYLTVEGAAQSVGAEAAEKSDIVDRVRPLDNDEGPQFELTLSDSAFQHVADAGARGERASVADGTWRLVVEAPGDADVRRVTDAVAERFDGVDLVAKRERDQDTPWWHAHGDIGARLTDRQRSVLRAAYYSGYYEWPRETDSETLADSLDIASTTFLQHLRKGHGRVLEALFDS